MKRMRDIVRAEADRLGMAAELLGRRRLLEACVRRFSATGVLPDLGWRAPLVGEAIPRTAAGDEGLSTLSTGAAWVAEAGRHGYCFTSGRAL